MQLCLNGYVSPTFWEKCVGNRGVGRYHQQGAVCNGAGTRRRWLVRDGDHLTKSWLGVSTYAV